MQEPLLVTGADQTVYVIDALDGKLRVFDPEKSRLGAPVTLAIDVDNATGEALIKQAFFADGALWVLTQNSLYRINSRTFKVAGFVTEASSDSQARQLSWASADSTGNIWAIDGASLVRIDAKNRSISKEIKGFYSDGASEEKFAVSTLMVCAAEIGRFRCFNRPKLEALLK